jgi:predicted nucleotidyltransferase
MTISPNEKKALSILRNKLMNDYNLVDIRLYGSKASGTDLEYSDLDVMIILDENSPEIEAEIDALIYDINLEYNCLISALFFSRQEIIEGPLQYSPIYNKILEEGISL